MKLSFKSKKLWGSLLIASFVLALALPLFSMGLVSAQSTYSVQIITPVNGSNFPAHVPITMDGAPTNFTSPHTFTDLSGVHTFTVPYEDSSGHPFARWSVAFDDNMFTTITVSSGGSYWAMYDPKFDRNNPTWPQYRYFVTPHDPAVVDMAANKSDVEIINWVATHISYNYTLGNINQFPNETLALRSGVCREYAGLCVSMLESQGYKAYVVAGNTTSSLQINHAWIILEINGTLYHIEPEATWNTQPTPQRWANNYTAWYFYNDKECKQFPRPANVK